MYKIRLQRYRFETCNKWTKWRGLSVDIRILSTKSFLPLPRGYIYVEKHKKMRIKSEFKENCLRPATNGRSEKGFLLASEVCPQGVFCPCLRAIYMYKIIKNVYKFRFQRDRFETYNIWARTKRPFCCHQNLSPMDCLPLPGAIYIMVKHETNVYKVRLQSKFFLNLQQRAFCWHQKFVPKGLSALARGYIHV